MIIGEEEDSDDDDDNDSDDDDDEDTDEELEEEEEDEEEEEVVEGSDGRSPVDSDLSDEEGNTHARNQQTSGGELNATGAASSSDANASDAALISGLMDTANGGVVVTTTNVDGASPENRGRARRGRGHRPAAANGGNDGYEDDEDEDDEDGDDDDEDEDDDEDMDLEDEEDEDGEEHEMDDNEIVGEEVSILNIIILRLSYNMFVGGLLLFRKPMRMMKKSRMKTKKTKRTRTKKTKTEKRTRLVSTSTLTIK